MSSRAGPRSKVAEGREFVVMLAVAMSMTALSIDLMLPTFPDMRKDFGMEPGSARVSWVITAFFLGMAVGPLLYGPASDRFGRRRPIYVGMTLYIVSAVAAALAPSFGLLVAARFCWGLGAAGSRTLALAVVRDRYEGDEMARLMSLMIAIFLLVPIFAPSIGAGLNAFAPWRIVFWVPAGLGCVLMVWARRLPETLPPERRRPFTVAALTSAFKEVVTNRTTLAFVGAMTLLMGVMTGYLSSSELILESVYDYARYFPLFFGVNGVMLALASLNNARIVGRLGIPKVVRRTSILAVTTGAVLLVVSLTTSGHPNFWVFAAVILVLLPFTQSLVPNCNTAAMIPLAHVAGTAAALIASFSTAGSALLGGVIAGSFDDTTSPYAVGAFVLLIPATALVWWATRSIPATVDERVSIAVEA